MSVRLLGMYARDFSGQNDTKQILHGPHASMHRINCAKTVESEPQVN